MTTPGLTYRITALFNRKIHSEKNIQTARLFHLFPSLGKNPRKEHTLKSPILMPAWGMTLEEEATWSELGETWAPTFKKTKRKKKISISTD